MKIWRTIFIALTACGALAPLPVFSQNQIDQAKIEQLRQDALSRQKLILDQLNTLRNMNTMTGTQPPGYQSPPGNPMWLKSPSRYSMPAFTRTLQVVPAPTSGSSPAGGNYYSPRGPASGIQAWNHYVHDYYNPFAPAGASSAVAPSHSGDSKPEIQQKQVFVFDGKVLTDEQHQALLHATDVRYIQKCDWENADEILRRAIMAFPDLYIAHSNRAFVLKKMGKLDQALAEANKAKELGPDKAEPLYMIAAIEQTMGKIDAAVEHYQLVVDKYPKHPMAKVTRALLERLRLESAKEQAIAKLIKPGTAADDYFEYVTYETIAKWPRDKFPLKVYMPPANQATKVVGYQPEYGQTLKDSFARWDAESHSIVRFIFVDSAKDADIECLWTGNPLALSNPAEAGETRTTSDLVKGMLHAKILLLTVSPGLPVVPVEDIKRTTLHEIGHSLGLFGHSPHADDIMYCSVSDQQHELTDRDTKTLLHLYQPDIHMAHEYHESDLPNNSIALNDDGVQLLASKDYEKAEEKFLAALKINPDCLPAKTNLATSLTALAQDNTAKGDLPTSVSQLKMALDLQESDPDRQEQSTRLHDLADVYTKLNNESEAKKCLAEADKLEKELEQSALATTNGAGGNDGSRGQLPGISGGRPQTIAGADPAPSSASGAYLLFSAPKSINSNQKSFQLSAEKRVKSDEIDFGSFMASLQRAIKRNWFPPKGNESKRVVVVFKVHSGGELSNLKVTNSSGLAIADQAAFQAVEHAAPFSPLPKGAPKVVDVQFTFDYNVFAGDGHGTFRRF